MIRHGPCRTGQQADRMWERDQEGREEEASCVLDPSESGLSP